MLKILSSGIILRANHVHKTVYSSDQTSLFLFYLDLAVENGWADLPTDHIGEGFE